MITRKSIRSERDYAESCAGVLQKQHDRIVTVIEALLQAVSWMRDEDLTDSERHMRQEAQRFIDEYNTCKKEKERTA
jgi:hypothetical protein